MASKRHHRPAFEVFRDVEEPVTKKASPARIALADITHSENVPQSFSQKSNAEITKKASTARVPLGDITHSSNEPQCSSQKSKTETQDSGVDVVFINDDMEITAGSPVIECSLSDLEESEERCETFVEPETSSRRDVQLDPKYFSEIFNYLREREETVRPHYDIMSQQTEINTGMRAILVDWLSDVCMEYSINVASLFLTVSIVDRMLSSFDCPKNKLQLIGAGALFIATKMEEIYPPTLAELVYTTADCYTKKQILRAEKLILKHLKFDICAPCRYWFGTFFANKIETTAEVESLMRYFLELSLMSDRFLLYRASEVGLASLYLANQWVKEDDDSVDVILDRAHILKDDIDPIMTEMAEQFKTVPKGEHQSIFQKFAATSEHSVALLEVPRAFK